MSKKVGGSDLNSTASVNNGSGHFLFATTSRIVPHPTKFRIQ